MDPVIIIYLVMGVLLLITYHLVKLGVKNTKKK